MALADSTEDRKRCIVVEFHAPVPLYSEYLFRCTDLCYVDLADTDRRILANASGAVKVIGHHVPVMPDDMISRMMLDKWILDSKM